MQASTGPACSCQSLLDMYQDSDHQSPMSLEGQCYLYLILHLEKFLPEEISLLPLRERQRLLVNLPAADVCQLEETSVVEGVSMNEVWKEIGQRQIKGYYKSVCESTLEKLQRGEGYRDHFHEVLSHTVIGEEYLDNIAVPFLLYTVVDCLGISDWQSRGIVPIKVDSGYDPADVAVLPPRYDQQFGNSSDLMLFSCFKMLPRKLSNKRYYAMESGATLRLLLSEVEELYLRSCGTRAETLCGILRRDTPEISESNSLVQCCGSKLNIVSVSLNDRSYMQKDTCYGRIETILTEPSSYSTFVMVKKLVVSLEYFHYDKCLSVLLKDLAMAVKYQLKLEDLLIEAPLLGWLPDTSWIADLLSALTEFVCRKTFRKFVLTMPSTMRANDTVASVLDVALYEKLLAPFSCAAPQQNRQVIEIHGLNITSGEEGIRVPLGHDVTAPRLRSVSFHDCSQVSESFLKRLLSLDIEIQVPHQQSIGKKRKIYDD